MSIMRHTVKLVRENDPGRGVSISTLARQYPRGSSVPPHAHGSDQLVYASHGVMQVSSGRSMWVIPPQFCIWVPARTLHRIRMPEPVSMRTLYLRRGIAPLPSVCRVLPVGHLLREIIFEIVRLGHLRIADRSECALCQVLVRELEQASPLPTEIALPRDQRALAVAHAVIDGLAVRKPLASQCASAGLSVRTLERIFRREVGTDFETWRRNVRLMRAVELLVSGSSVKEAAFDVGYQQPNPLVALFRQTFGKTPKSWISTLNRRH